MADKLSAALAKFQAELPRIGKGNTANTGTYSFKYADLADVSAVVLPLLGKHGLSFSARPTLDEQGRFVLAYSLMHESGEEMPGAYPLPSTGTPQQIGSAITYARRYALCSVSGVAADADDDGQSAPPADRRPAERHESSWDPEQQEALREKYEERIAAATAEEIAEIGKELLEEKRSHRMSPATYQHLAVVGGRRKGELDRAAQTEQQQPTVSLPSDGPAPTERAMKRMHATFRELGFSQDAKYPLMSRVTGREITSSTQLTAVDVDAVIVELDKRKAEMKGAVTDGSP